MRLSNDERHNTVYGFLGRIEALVWLYRTKMKTPSKVAEELESELRDLHAKDPAFFCNQKDPCSHCGAKREGR